MNFMAKSDNNNVAPYNFRPSVTFIYNLFTETPYGSDVTEYTARTKKCTGRVFRSLIGD